MAGMIEGENTEAVAQEGGGAIPQHRCRAEGGAEYDERSPRWPARLRDSDLRNGHEPLLSSATSAAASAGPIMRSV
jgi:hypothetical protein